MKIRLKKIRPRVLVFFFFNINLILSVYIFQIHASDLFKGGGGGMTMLPNWFLIAQQSIGTVCFLCGIKFTLPNYFLISNDIFIMAAKEK